MKTVNTSEFKTQCLQLMDDVVKSGDSIVITRDGQPIARLCPIASKQSATLVGRHKGEIRIVGDIVTSLDESWDAECSSC